MAEVLQSWRTPGGKRFQVRTSSGLVFDLQYQEQTGAWRVTNQ